ncbi:MAG: chromosome segregation protein SMC [Cytophagaceae bacterium]|nr:chromosome segregation protein SMC [Cytophagaceae bacterium]MDW8455947.1 chromosome segregation protein SMC [Cytophagaceae bacterium]
MQLSKLEIKGFKSFGDKVVINFDEGITGIVGPNGCGKSNVVDAIRWVLGEQKTKALRSEKMENVIFNGTKNRKPMQMAEVSLTFNNTKNLLPTEYSHVTITRRYFRSGESEYLLNGVTCRLKDITDLFLDTGIGPDSYAIIELKMVDDILNDKDNSRRNLFEEAAGISKFKVRKKQSLKKLEETDKDLERVEDLLFEINKNLKSLEKQAKQTEKYFQIKEEYKQVSIELAKVSLHGLRQELAELHKKLDDNNNAKAQLASRIAEAESNSEKQKADLLNKEKLLASRQKTLNEHVNKIRNFESDKKIKNERLKLLNDRYTSLQSQIEQDKANTDKAEADIQRLEQEKTGALQAFETISKELEQLKKKYDEQKNKCAELQEEASQVNKTFKQKQEEVYELNKKLDIYAVQVNSLKQELEKTTNDTGTHEQSLKQFSIKAAELSKSLEEKNNILSQLQASEKEIAEKITSCEKEIESIKEKITQTNRKLDQKQNEYNLTKSMIDNLEGFPEAIKFLKKNANWGKEYPLLSDIISCEEKYKLALENFLEPFMNYYIVETESQAIHAVNLLNAASKGKANFFILSKFVNFNPSPIKNYPNCISAIEIAEYNPTYKSLIQYLLNDVYLVVTNQDELPTDPNAIFLTQNGIITKRKYSISGGSVGLFEGKRIGRVKNLEKLEAEIKDLTLELEGIKANLDIKFSELNRLKESTKKQAIESLNKEINLLNQEYISFKTKKEQYEQMLSKNSLRKEEISAKIAELEKIIQETKPETELKKNDLLGLETKLNSVNEKLVEENTLLSNKSAAYNQHNIIYHQQQNKIKSLEQEITFKQSALQSAVERINKNTEESKNIEQEIKQLSENSDTNEEELLNLYKEKESIEAGLNEAEKEYYAVRTAIDELEKQVRELRKNREQLDAEHLQLQNQLNETKLSMTSTRERLSVEFNVDIDELLSDTNSTETITLSEQELKEKTEKIKNTLDKMGPINPMAMEAYNEILERHTFITNQKEDLIKAKQSLLSTITEIDQVAKETFMDCFTNIRENFVRVFRSLFTEEDSCNLELTDPDNPLESPIEIIARPKGKRPLTINQLSGGEKTLTAISLLFAIYLIKPAPFCIFDEVDAPLDDANIDKFNNIIRKFSNESQFIIVTHNKRTMASTDVIYGITMVEQGVSRIVPVDLRTLQAS